MPNCYKRVNVLIQMICLLDFPLYFICWCSVEINALSELLQTHKQIHIREA